MADSVNLTPMPQFPCGSRPRRFIFVVLALALSACASVEQYSADPENTQVSLQKYQSYFDPALIDQYERTAPASQRALRNSIVLNRMLAYDLTYSAFKRSLSSNANTVKAGGDLVLLILTGLTATTGNAATKAAFGAAAAGILGAQTAISKDLYFERTLPALLSQMDANRARAKTAIIFGLQQDVDKYPIEVALLDLNTLKDMGSVTAGISEITQQSSAANAAAQNDLQRITFARDAKFGPTLPQRAGILKAINALSDSKALLVAAAMELHLTTRSNNLRAEVTALDPTRQRLSDPVIARRVLGAWISDEDPTAANFQEWNDALK